MGASCKETCFPSFQGDRSHNFSFVCSEREGVKRLRSPSRSKLVQLATPLTFSGAWHGFSLGFNGKYRARNAVCKTKPGRKTAQVWAKLCMAFLGTVFLRHSTSNAMESTPCSHCSDALTVTGGQWLGLRMRRPWASPGLLVFLSKARNGTIAIIKWTPAPPQWGRPAVQTLLGLYLTGPPASPGPGPFVVLLCLRLSALSGLWFGQADILTACHTTLLGCGTSSVVPRRAGASLALGFRGWTLADLLSLLLPLERLPLQA